MSTAEGEKELIKLLAKKFIARPDLRAIQFTDGHYEPMRPSQNGHSKFPVQSGFDVPSLLDHVRGVASYGHYMVNQEDTTKLFVLDIDLEKKGYLPFAEDEYGVWSDFRQCSPREFWTTRQPGPGRKMIKTQLRILANQAARTIRQELDIQVAVAYSGHKGVHVYGFMPKPLSAADAREGARIVVEAMGTWQLVRGEHIFGFVPEKQEDIQNPYGNFHQYTMEVYPKQDNLAGKDLGNLVRLPTGRNLKSPKDGAFFLDLRAPLSEFIPRDPVEALTTSDPWG